MTLWVILTLFMAGAALVVLAPFFFGSGAGESATSVDVYRDQLAEIDRDKAQGQIDEAEAASARLEIERRILKAGRSGTGPSRSISANAQYRMVTGVTCVVVLGAVGLYAVAGRPDLPASPTQALAQSQPQAPGATQPAQNVNTAEGRQAEVAEMVKKLEKRVADSPNDVDGLRMLGWAYYSTGRYKEAVTTYRRGVDLQKDNPTLKALLGEAMVVEAGNNVTESALAVFEEVLAISPNDERARFFKGVSKAQKGDNQGAIDEWMALYKVAPADAEWAADLRTRIEETAQQSGIDVSAKLAEARPAPAAKPAAARMAEAHPTTATPSPSATDVENAKQMKPEDQQAMVSGMVDRLASRLEASPKDADGWIMLIRSRMVMKDADQARVSLEKAKTIFADDPDTQNRIVQAAQALGVVAN
jgi:cytochrome c-type biogenesis protein CcmH